MLTGDPLCQGAIVTGELWGQRELQSTSIYCPGLSLFKLLAGENVCPVQASSKLEELPGAFSHTNSTVC